MKWHCSAFVLPNFLLWSNKTFNRWLKCLLLGSNVSKTRECGPMLFLCISRHEWHGCLNNVLFSLHQTEKFSGVKICNELPLALCNLTGSVRHCLRVEQHLPSESVFCLALSYSAPHTSISIRGQTMPRPCLGRWRAPKTFRQEEEEEKCRLTLENSSVYSLRDINCMVSVFVERICYIIILPHSQFTSFLNHFLLHIGKLAATKTMADSLHLQIVSS